MPTNVTATGAVGAATAKGATYTVKAGDTLFGIAKRTLGDGNRWQQILDLNKGILPSADKLKPGMVLSLPAGAAAPSAPATTPAQPRPEAPRTAPANVQRDSFQRVVNLTFDDGPNPTTTPRILDILKRHGAKATFFVTGANVDKYPELVRRIVAEGHQLGNHTYTHADLNKLSKEGAKAEFRRCAEAIDRALGKHYQLEVVRPPYGNVGKAKEAVEPGQKVLLWNVDSNDWRYSNDDAKIFQNIFEGSYSVHARGGTILMHDIKPQTARTLDAILTRLDREGFDVQLWDPNAKPAIR